MGGRDEKRGWEEEDYTRGIKDVKEIEGLESLD